MSTVQELKKRADELRNKTAVNSITPDEVGSLIFDTIDYMYSIESSGIFKMMSSLADTTNPSAADQIPVIGAEIAQKASITTVVGKGLQNAETQTELDSVPVIRGTKVGQMAKSDIAVKLCESFEQNLPTYRPNTDTFDQIRIRKSETGESYYISKEDLAEVVGGLAFPGLRWSNSGANVMRTPTGVGIAIAYNSLNPSDFCAVMFGINVGVSINYKKIAGNLDVDNYNNMGTLVVNGADHYTIIGI